MSAATPAPDACETYTIKGAHSVEVYTSCKGYACIRQYSDIEGEEVTIVMTADQVIELAGALQALGEDRAKWEFCDQEVAAES